MKKKDKPITLDGVIGTWTGVAIFMVIMTAFGWWYVWWAYIALIGIISGAIQQTVAYVQKKNSLAEPNNSVSTSKSADLNTSFSSCHLILILSNSFICGVSPPLVFVINAPSRASNLIDAVLILPVP